MSSCATDHGLLHVEVDQDGKRAHGGARVLPRGRAPWFDLRASQQPLWAVLAHPAIAGSTEGRR